MPNRFEKSQMWKEQKPKLNIGVEFVTRDGGDWNSCVIQLYMSFSGTNKFYSNRYIPNMTLVLASSDTNMIMYQKVWTHISQYLRGSEVSQQDVQIKTNSGGYIAPDATSVCKNGGKHFMVHLDKGGSNKGTQGKGSLDEDLLGGNLGNSSQMPDRRGRV